MERTTLFIGLTRSVTFAGLPILYFSILIGVSILGFIITGSFLYVVITPAIGYPALRLLSAYDPKIIDVFFVVMRATVFAPKFFHKSGVIYRA